MNTFLSTPLSIPTPRWTLAFTICAWRCGFEYALGLAEDIATRIHQYTNEYLDNITPPFTKALFTYAKEGKYTFCTPGHMAGTAYQKSPPGCLFYDFLAAIP